MTLKSIKTAFIYNTGPSTFVPSSQLTGSYFFDQQWCTDWYSNNYPCSEYTSGAYPNTVGLELTFQINAPTQYADAEFVVYKEFQPGWTTLTMY